MDWAPREGERLEYVATWNGLEAGRAVAETHAAGANWSTTVESHSAEWLALLYPVNDVVTSVWALDGGSVSYTTRYREGGFQQDQVLRFGVDSVAVERRQYVRGAWKDSTDTILAPEHADDPLSAVLHLRSGGPGDRRLDVVAGRRSVPVYVSDAGLDAVNGRPARRYELRTRDEGVLRDRITAWITEDAARIPAKAVVHTRAGAVTVTWVPPAR